MSEQFQAIVKSRIAEHQAAEEKKEVEQRERIRAEEQAKAEKAARDELAAEQRRKDEEYLAGAEQRERERQAEIAAAVLQVRRDAEAAKPSQPPTETVAAVLAVSLQALNVVPMGTRAPAKPTTPPTLRLGQIGERLGFNVTADFLTSLGFPPAATEKASKLFHAEDFHAIGKAIIEHIETVCELQAESI